MIKVSTLRSLLHDKDGFSKRSKDFLQSIEDEIDEKLVITNTADYDCDLKLIFIESGGSEMLFKNAMASMQEPYYFLTSGDDNSLAATLEILTYLNTLNLHGEVLHGSPKYIGKRINELKKKSQRLLEGKRYGVVGKPSDWLIASIPDYKALEDKFGCKLINIPLEEVINNFNYVGEVELLKTDSKELKSAEKVNILLNDIVSEHKLDGLTIRCFDLLDTIHTTGCLALAKLNAKGVIGTCEGDVMAMISMAIAKEVANESSFQANPARINTEDNTILFAHCTVPFDMLTSFTYKTHFESGIGVAIKGELKEENVTVLRLSSDLRHSFISRGVIIENKDMDNLCRTQIVVRMEEDVKELLKNPCGNHHIIFYGDHVDKLKQILN